jgi:hypothetical protein
MIALSCPQCGAQVPDPARFAAAEQAYCQYCRQTFLIDHTAGSRVCAVVPHGGFSAATLQRIRQLGFRPGTIWTRRDFAGWQPATRGEALLIGVCVQFGPPFAAGYWHDTLTRAWPQLVDEIGAARHGQLSAIAGRGNPVVIVYGQTEYDLRAAIAEAKLDAAAAAPDAHVKVTPGTVSVVVPDNRFVAACHQRIAQLGSRVGRTSGRDFNGWQPAEATEALLVAVCAQCGPPFAAHHWHDYLGRSWPELIDTIGSNKSGQLEAKSPQGRRVVIAFGHSEHDLHHAIAQLTW